MISTLLADLARRGITIVADGDRLRYRPIDAMTPDLLARLKAHKAELLAMLRPAPEAAPSGPGDAETDARRDAGADPPRSDPMPEPDGRECIDAGDVSPCAKCRGLMMWWDAAGGVHCLDCDPPTASRRLMDLAERIRRRPPRPAAQDNSRTFQRKRKKYAKPPKEKIKNSAKIIANPGPCPHHLDPATWSVSPDPGRAGWVRTVCNRCGKFLGYHPSKRR